MGAGNVALVCTHWADLPGDAFKALVYMALITLDRDEKPAYWGGPDALVAAIGRDGTKPTSGDRQALQRAIRLLVERGIVAVDKPASRWHHATYSLALTPSESDA